MPGRQEGAGIAGEVMPGAATATVTAATTTTTAATKIQQPQQ